MLTPPSICGRLRLKNKQQEPLGPERIAGTNCDRPLDLPILAGGVTEIDT